MNVFLWCSLFFVSGNFYFSFVSGYGNDANEVEPREKYKLPEKKYQLQHLHYNRQGVLNKHLNLIAMVYKIKCASVNNNIMENCSLLSELSW